MVVICHCDSCLEICISEFGVCEFKIAQAGDARLEFVMLLKIGGQRQRSDRGRR